MSSPKVRYVQRARRHDGTHECHWPGCDQKVPPAKWGCRKHWFMLPSPIRVRIWQAFVPGQEISKRPSETYVAAARAAQDWIAEHFPAPPEQPELL